MKNDCKNMTAKNYGICRTVLHSNLLKLRVRLPKLRRKKNSTWNMKDAAEPGLSRE